jgi:two-component system cell cycle response regulator DivK
LLGPPPLQWRECKHILLEASAYVATAICSGDFEAITAEDGEKGCEKAVSERPDIILMDLQMPVMDGWEAARRLKSIPETSDIPIIGLSAHALAGERDKALGAGCDEFDTKPIEFERLVATIRRLCEMQLARKAG